MSKSNAFVKEYVTGRKDQFDLDYLIFREAVKSATSKEELTGIVKQKSDQQYQTSLTCPG